MLGSCGGKRPSLGSLPPSTTARSTTTTQPVDGTSTTSTPSSKPRTLGTDDLLGYIATPIGDPKVYEQPAGDAAEVPGIGPKTEAGAPTVFAVVGDASPGATLPNAGWYEVALPTRPNGDTGWVRTTDVTITKTPMRIFVDLDGRSLRLEKDGTTILTADVAIGTEENPTPVGGTFVTELVQYPTPKAYGPYAYGLGFHSDTLSEFEGGDGRVAIHGTNKPNLIGQRVSHGCVRMNNEDVEKLVDQQLPLGIPVFIT
jgi:lipoprotein-anchoring transpeptidase ErfK/SrfK